MQTQRHPRSRFGLISALLAAALVGLCLVRDAASEAQAFPPHIGRPQRADPHMQRTLGLLATSTPHKRNRVRVLFYGQSITEQGWVVEVERALRQRYPHADLVLENRALGGYPAQLLLKTAETDLYSFYPDLLVFHAYGAHDAYDALIRRVRERTTAEVMIQTDHVTHEADLREETRPDRVRIDESPWSVFMNQRWLPEVRARYQTAWCDPRSVWKTYLTHYQLAPSALLSDEIHPNAHGDYLLAESIKECLVYSRSVRPQAAQWVQEIRVGPGSRFDWQQGRLRVPFTGNRVDVIFEARGAASRTTHGDPYEVLIDGRAPSAWPELYSRTRAISPAGGKWPLITEIQAEAAPVAERFRMEVETLSRNPERYAFRLFGSVSGFEGEGRSDERFVSNSKRVVLEPTSWGVAYALSLAGREVPKHFEVTWNVIPRGVDQFGAEAPGRRGSEASLTIAQGLPNTRHLLELRGSVRGIARLRVYRPPLGRTL